MIGQMISHYRILDKLGEGGMGIVYKAEDTKLRRNVALKFLPGRLVDDASYKNRFIREAQVAAALDHPNICSVYEIGEADGQLFIAMACIEGPSLKEKLAAGQLDQAEALDIANQVAAGLQAAHEKGIVHRDVKPANIMLTANGKAVVTDFGLAKMAGAMKLTKTGTTQGTAAYMSPEQVLGEDTDHRTDIWALGVITYEMLTGRTPFRGDYEPALTYNIVHGKPELLGEVKSGIPDDIVRFVEKALSRKPESRFEKMAAMASELEKLLRSPNGPASRSRLRPWSRYPLRIAGVTLVLVALLVAAQLLDFGGLDQDNVIGSIAVLPLENNSDEQEEAYFIDGVTDELVSRLAKVHSLTVISPTSARAAIDKYTTLQEIAEALQVDALVQCSIVRQQQQVRIIANLIHAATDDLMWSDSYTVDLQDILAAQGEIVHAIVRQIEIVLSPEEEQLVTDTRQIDPQAYEAYLRGRHFLNRMDPEGLNLSLQYFDQAIAIEPDYVEAFIGLADCYLMLRQITMDPLVRAGRPWRMAATRALELDETSAEAHGLMGHILFHDDWDWSGAERHYLRALELDPNSKTAHGHYSQWLNGTGRHEEALAEILKAQRLDPLHAFLGANVGARYWLLNQNEQAVLECRKALEIAPNNWVAHWVLGIAYTAQGEYGQAIGALQVAFELSGEALDVRADIAYTYAKAGNQSAAQEILEYLLARVDTNEVPASILVTVYLGLGQRDKVLEWLERAVQDHNWRIVTAINGPRFDELRQDPKFREIVRRTGIPGY